MDYQEFKCKNCGSSIPIGHGATRIKCGYCGTEYALSPNFGQGYAPMKQIDYLGRGALFRSFVPRGWSGRVLEDDSSTSASAASCKGLRLDSPDGASLLFYPFAYFKSFQPGGLGLRKNYSLDPAVLLRYRKRSTGEEYAKERLQELLGAEDSSLEAIADNDGILQRRVQRFLGEAAKALKKPVTGGYGKVQGQGRLQWRYIQRVFRQRLGRDKAGAPGEQSAAQAGGAVCAQEDRRLLRQGAEL